jgi:hypothetical protein
MGRSGTTSGDELDAKERESRDADVKASGYMTMKNSPSCTYRVSISIRRSVPTFQQSLINLSFLLVAIAAAWGIRDIRTARKAGQCGHQRVDTHAMTIKTAQTDVNAA